MTRKEILSTAEHCVCGDREQDYGTPENNFRTIAKMWTAFINASGRICVFTAADVAAMMALVKLSRIGSGQSKDDNWVDLAGYAACGGEVSQDES